MPKLVAPVVAAGRLSGRRQPSLRTDELVLRPWQPADAPSVVEAYRDPAIRTWHARSMTKAEALSWVTSWPERWAAETGVSWAVVNEGRLLGRMGLNALNLEEGAGEAAYWILPEARGRDVAPRALNTVVDWAFADVGLHRIELGHSTRNEASCRVAAKAGFQLEGTRRQQVLHADGWHDMHLHARLGAR